MGSSRRVGNTSMAPQVHYSAGSIRGVQDLHPTAGNTTAHTTNEHPSSNPHTQVNMGSGLASLPNKSVLPNLETIRRFPSVSEAVSNILASYDSQNKQESTQSKTYRRSGRYNNYDTVSASPEVRWPNEGFHGSNRKKRLLYDDMSMPQWVAGQLTNIVHMQDHIIARQALVQVIAAMKDAVSIPFTAVKNAWACSMHELEVGNLAWGDSTQWALNRLSASQVSMIGSHSASLSQKKFCKYFNEGSCTHEGHHGLYKHNCSFCGRQGRQQTILKVNVTLKIRNKKDHQLLPARGQVYHLDTGVGTMTLNSVKSNLKNWLMIVMIYSSLVKLLATILVVYDNFINVCDNSFDEGLNDNLHVYIQSDNVLYSDNIGVQDSAEVQHLVNHFYHPADGVSTVKGELLCTQVTTQHNRGGGCDCKVKEQQHMNQLNQISC